LSSDFKADHPPDQAQLRLITPLISQHLISSPDQQAGQVLVSPELRRLISSLTAALGSRLISG
jgi:hypothetical protein